MNLPPCRHEAFRSSDSVIENRGKHITDKDAKHQAAVKNGKLRITNAAMQTQYISDFGLFGSGELTDQSP
jgi:hypothetical protein